MNEKQKTSAKPAQNHAQNPAPNPTHAAQNSAQNPALAAIDELMARWVAECGYARAGELFARVGSGKKLRSKLILKIAPASEPSVRLCAVIELIQAASLLHDDVIDNAATRRGKPSINATFGDKTAIMLGDILYAKALLEAVRLGAGVASVVAAAVVKLSVGEMQDVFLAREFNADRAAYTQMIYNKTAALIEASAECAAMLAGAGAAGDLGVAGAGVANLNLGGADAGKNASNSNLTSANGEFRADFDGEIAGNAGGFCAQNLARAVQNSQNPAQNPQTPAQFSRQNYAKYGANLGLAFQVIDDILDITSDSAKLGKPAFSDFGEGKTTLPYIILHERLGGAGRARLLGLFGRDLSGEDEFARQNREWLRGQFAATGALAEAVRIAREYGARALAATSSPALAQIVREMIERDF